MSRRVSLAASWPVFALLVFASAPAQGAPIVYTETFRGEGQLGGSYFFDALVTLTLVGDTDNVTGVGLLSNTGTATVNVAGIGSGTFTGDVRAAVVQGVGTGGFADFSAGLVIMYTDHPGLASYDLASSIGPLTGDARFNAIPFATTAGGFAIYSVSGLFDESTFTAAIERTAIPEPATLVLFGIGLVAVARRHW